MRPAFRRGWEGEGKLNRCPSAGQRARSDRHTGATILLWETRGQSPWRSRQLGNGAGQAPPAAARHRQRGATQAGDVAASQAVTRLLSRRGSAASHCERVLAARPARREASVPAGQFRNTAPSRSAKRGKECDLRKSRSFSKRSRS